MFAGVWYVATMVAVGGNVMQQRCQCAIPRSISVHDFFRPAHVRRNVRIYTQRILAIRCVDICNHALLVGYGRVGSLLGEKLLASDIPLVVIETSRTRVDELRERGVRAVLGNAANEEIMQLAHLECAKWLILTIPNGYEAGEIVASARAKNPDIEIIARAHYDDEVAYITERGANQVVMGEREIARTMLELLETPPAGEVVTG